MNLISAYPTFTELENLKSTYNPKQINVFLDLRNSLSSIYIDDVVTGMLEVTNHTHAPNLMIFLSWLDFVQFHYNFMMKNECNVHIFTFADTGDYLYHKSIYKNYKANRCVTKSRSDSETAKNELQKMILKNIETIMKASNNLFNTHGVYLKYCESDFVPHHIISKKFKSDDYLNVIYSSDRDMIQTLKFPNTVQIMKKSSGERKFVTYNNWEECYDIDKMDVNSYIFMKAIMGDTGDGIDGVAGLGPKKSAKLIKEIGSIKNFKDFQNKLVEESHHETSIGKYAVKASNAIDVLYRNYRLMSFEELINNLSLVTVEKFEKLFDDNERMTLANTMEFIEEFQRWWVDCVKQE